MRPWTEPAAQTDSSVPASAIEHRRCRAPRGYSAWFVSEVLATVRSAT